jgi:hypothetical protein
MFEEVRAARSDLEGRGVLRSGMTAEKADHLTAKYGYRWDQGSKTYRRTLRSRIGPPWLVAVALVFAIVGFVAPFTGQPSGRRRDLVGDGAGGLRGSRGDAPVTD